MKHFVNYFLTEKSTPSKILDVLLTIKAVKDKNGKISTADDDVQTRVQVKLDPDVNYTKTKLPQGEFLKLVFNELLSNPTTTKKLSNKLGKNNIPYAIAIDKIEQNQRTRWSNQKEISHLIGKEAEAQAKQTGNKVPPITKLVYDDSKDKRIHFLDVDKYLSDDNVVVHQSSGSQGKKLEKEYLEIIKAKASEEPTEEPIEEPDTEEKTIDNRVADDEPTEPDQSEEPTQSEEPVEEPAKTLPSIECIAIVNEVISADGKVVIPDTNVENKLTINLTDTAATDDFGNNIYIVVAKHCINNFSNKISKDVIPLTIVIDNVKYNMSDDTKQNVEKYFTDETIVYDSDNAESGEFTFTDENCLLMSSQAGKAYYDKKTKVADTVTDKEIAADKKSDNKSILGKIYDKLFSTKNDTTKSEEQPKTTSNEINRTTRQTAASDLLGSIGKKSTNTNDITTASTYTSKDTELAMKILTALGISRDKAQQVIDKFVNK